MTLKEGLWRSMCEWFWPLITERKNSRTDEHMNVVVSCSGLAHEY